MADFTIDDMIEQLQAMKQEHGGDKIVMFVDPNGEGEYYSVHSVNHHVVEYDDEFPEEWEMEKGFEYILLKN